MSSLNPYEFMGLTSESSIADLRKRYASMAQYCHPDKGGSNESMIVLQASYEWIKCQMENIKAQPDYGKTYEEIQAEFDKYVADNQFIKPPSYLRTILESLDITTEECKCILDRTMNDDNSIRERILKTSKVVNDSILVVINELLRKYDNNVEKITKDEVLAYYEQDLKNFIDIKPDEMMYSSIPHGYGDLMDGSKISLEENDDATTPLTTPFEKRELVMYKEPTSIFTADIETAANPTNETYAKREDYTVNNPRLYMTDYLLAHSETTNASSIFDDLVSTEPIDVLYAIKKLERATLQD